MSDIRRREFMILLGAAAAWPLAARAQQPDRVRRVGVLMGIADDFEGQTRMAVFRQRLQALGWTEGRNVQFIYRWSAGDALQAPVSQRTARIAVGRDPHQLDAGHGRGQRYHPHDAYDICVICDSRDVWSDTFQQFKPLTGYRGLEIRIVNRSSRLLLGIVCPRFIRSATSPRAVA
jgi:hypothetical protein